MNDKRRNFGLILKELRLHRDMTQEELALLIKKTTGSIAQFESGDIYPNYETLSAIIKALDIDANLFFSKGTAEYSTEAIWIGHLLSDMNNDEKKTIIKFFYNVSQFLGTSYDNSINGEDT